MPFHRNMLWARVTFTVFLVAIIGQVFHAEWIPNSHVPCVILCVLPTSWDLVRVERVPERHSDVTDVNTAWRVHAHYIEEDIVPFMIPLVQQYQMSVPCSVL